MNLSSGRMRQLTTRERRFLKHYLRDGMDQVDAYLEAVKKADGTYPCSRATAHVTACRMLARLRKSPALWQDILAAAEIDNYTLASDLHRMRTAKKTEFYQGEAVADVEDNGTQMRAIELIAELLGHKKAIDLSGVITIRYEKDVDAGFTKRDDSSGSNPEA